MHVLGGAGEGHRRVQGQRQHPGLLGGGQHADPGRTGGVAGQLAAAPGAGPGEPGDQAGEGVVGDGQHDEVAGGHHLVGAHQRHPGQQPGGALGGRGGQARGRDHLVAGGGERGAEDGAHPAGADHAHAQAGGGLGGRGQPGGG